METPLNVPVELIRSFELFRVVKYMQVVSFSIFLCDYLQMLELEIAVVWQTKWGIGNILYLFSRLLPFFDVPLVIFYRLYPNVPTLPNRVCDVLYKIETWCTVLGIFASEIMLVMMIYALTSNKIIRWWLIGQTVTVGSAACVTLGIFSASLQFGEAPLPIPTGCLLVGGKFIFAGVGFIILALNQFSLMVIVLGVGVARYRHSNSTLVKVLYRDGVFYYVFLFLVSAAEVVVLLLAPSELSDLLTTFQRVMHSILAAHVWLNARSIARGMTVSVLRDTSQKSEIALVDIRVRPGRGERSQTMVDSEMNLTTAGTVVPDEERITKG